MYKKIIWPAIVLITSVLALIFLSGFVYSVFITTGEDELPVEEQAVLMDDTTEEPIAGMPEGADDGQSIPDPNPEEWETVLVVGDSLGSGVGDEDGLGFDQRYLELLSQDDNQERELTNISVPGFVSSQLADQLDTGEYDSDIETADLILISIGGNDLNRLYFQNTETMIAEFDETLSAFLSNLESLLSTIRSLNPEAQLALIGLYDPYNIEDQEINRLLLEWNHASRLAASADARLAYIPTYEAFQYHLADYLSDDLFHPNGAGYQTIAESLYQVLN